MASSKPKSGPSTTQWLAFFVVLVMVVSTVSFSLLSGSSNPPSDQPPVTPTDTTPATELSFSAQTNSKVVDLLPVTRFSAVALTPEIDRIDSAILSAGGITQVNSSFKQQPNQPGALLYLAEIRFDKQQVNLDGVMANVSLTTANLLSNHAFFPYALLELPPKVTFTNSDLNLSKEHFFLDQLATGLVNSTTHKDDSLSVQLNALFAGSQLKSLEVFELSNESIATKTFTIKDSFDVFFVQPELLFASEAPFESALSKSALESSLQTIADVNRLEVGVFPKEPVRFSIDAPADLNAVETVLNSSSFALNPQTVSPEQPFSFSVSLNSPDDLNQLQSLLQTELQRQQIQSNSLVFEPWPVVVQARLFLSEQADPVSVSTAVVNKLSNRLSDLQLFQSGVIKASELTVPASQDTNVQSFVLTTGQFNALLSPGVQAGQTVELEIQFQTVRNTVADATAVQSSQ